MAPPTPSGAAGGWPGGRWVLRERRPVSRRVDAMLRAVEQQEWAR